jgi:hypothetical protein
MPRLPEHVEAAMREATRLGAQVTAELGKRYCLTITKGNHIERVIVSRNAGDPHAGRNAMSDVRRAVGRLNRAAEIPAHAGGTPSTVAG